MTTNGVSTSRTTTVISIVTDDEGSRVGSLSSAEVDPALIPELVAASAAAAAQAPPARDAAPLLGGTDVPRTGTRRCPRPARRCSPSWQPD